MKILKKSFVGRVVGGVLSGIIWLMPSGGLALDNQNVIDSQIPSSSVSVKQNVNQDKKQDEKQSEQLYRTKTGKCYHKSNCSCLRNSKIKVSQEEIEEANLRSCSKCCKKASH